MVKASKISTQPPWCCATKKHKYGGKNKVACNNRAAYLIDNKELCTKHAQSYALNILIEANL